MSQPKQKKLSPSQQALEDRVTHLLSEWLNDNAPIGEERYRLPAQAVIAEVKAFYKKALAGEEPNNG